MIRILLRSYPPGWRARYGDELAELLAETGLGPREAIDVLRAGLRERRGALRALLIGGDPMTIGPAWRHPTGWALVAAVLVAPTLTFVVLSMLAYQLGIAALQPVMEPLNAWLDGRRLADLVLVLAPLVAVLLAVAPLVRLEISRGADGTQAMLGVRLRALNVLTALAGLAVGGLLVWHILAESVLRIGA